MIRINLLHERKSKRAEKSQQVFLVGLIVIGVFAGLLYFFLQAPLQEQVDEITATNNRLSKKNKELQQDTQDFDSIKQQAEAVQAQAESISRLNNARAVPAWMLRELAGIMTRGQEPTMTKEMAERVRTDRNRQWSRTWDPKRVWLDEFVEEDGVFTLKGGAQSDGDVTQLALRMMASVFFTEIVPQGMTTVEGKAQGTSFYNFTLTGRVNY